MPTSAPLASFSDMSMLEKLAALGKGGLLQFKHWSEADKHVAVPERQLRELRSAEYGLPRQRVNRNAMDRAVNYAGGYDWGARPSVPVEDALDMAKAYQLLDYMKTFDPQREADAQKDYEENVAGVLAAQPYRNQPRKEQEMLREAAQFGKQGYADGGRVSPLKVIREELPKFWESEQAAGARGMLKGLGDLLGISSASEPTSVMSDYPSEENAVRALTPIAAGAAPLARAAAPLARLAMRNPLTTGAALTYATEDPTNLIMNPIALAATYTPEAEAVVKPKGGNWLNSVENALKTLKSSTFRQSIPDLSAELATYKPGSESYERVLREIDLLKKNQSLNDWVGGPLTKYVKTYMGTAEDPVRALAEQGILHINPEELNIRRGWLSSEAANKQLIGKSPEARAWEGASDLPINPMKRKDLSLNAELENPWVDKLSPEDPVYGLLDLQNTPRDLGFTHLRDELRNAMNPQSGLPASLQLKPEDLKQMGMEKAVRHVAAINAWREAQQAEANMAKAMNPATHTVKEYPEGYKLVELKAPSTLPEGVKLEPKAGGFDIVGPQGEDLGWAKTEKEAIQQSNSSDALAEALKYEGDTMGHCVGGYCDPVMKGESRIFSIRDAKGRPHVTIEVRPANRDEFIQNNYKDYSDMLNEGPKFANAWVDRQLVKSPQKIVQIKGKGNKAPAEKYQGMVQDFIRSQEWGDIGDLANSGLIKGPKGSYVTPQEMLQQYENLPDTAKSMPMVQERMNWLKEGKNLDYDFTDNLDYIARNSWGRYAQGGSVQPAHFDDLSAFLSRKN